MSGQRLKFLEALNPNRRRVLASLIGLVLFLFAVYFWIYAGWSVPDVLKSYDPQKAQASIARDTEQCLVGDWLDRKKQDCLKELAEEFVARYSTADVQAALAGIENPEFKQVCHEFMHYLGQSAYRANAGNLVAAYAIAQPLCDSGMYHGVSEQYIIDHITQGALSDTLEQLARSGCEVFESEIQHSDGYRSMCYHGMGHGMMFAAEYDLPSALKFCDYAPDNGAASACQSGVFMENISSAAFVQWSDHERLFSPTSEDVTYPCRILRAQDQRMCYQFQGVALQNLFYLTFEESFRACREFPDEYRKTCIWGLGANIPGAHIETPAVESVCRDAALPLGSDAYETCISGAIAQLGQFHTGDPAPLVEFCSLVLEDEKADCWAQTRDMLIPWQNAEDNFDFCTAFPPGQPQDICLSLRQN